MVMRKNKHKKRNQRKKMEINKNKKKEKKSNKKKKRKQGGAEGGALAGRCCSGFPLFVRVSGACRLLYSNTGYVNVTFYRGKVQKAAGRAVWVKKGSYNWSTQSGKGPSIKGLRSLLFMVYYFLFIYLQD